jgi:hypothetical protein
MMKPSTLLLAMAAASAASWAIAEAAPAATWPTARAAIESRRFLIGTWRCTFTVGRVSGEYTTQWSAVLDGLWLNQTYDQPRQSGTTFAFKADYLIGYDEQRKEWIRFGAMSTGQYFAIRMVDAGDRGWHWTYVSFFALRQHLPRSGYDAVFTRKSDALYAIDGPTYPNKNGVTVTEHHVCRKS